MNYHEIINNEYPKLEEAKELFIRAIQGTEEDKWNFVFSQAGWIAEILRSMGKYDCEDDIIISGLLSIYKTISFKTLTPKVPFWGFSRIAKFRLRNDIAIALKVNRHQIYLPREVFGVGEVNLDDKEDVEMGTSIGEVEAKYDKYLVDLTELGPAEQVEQKDLTERCIEIISKIAANKKQETGQRLIKLCGAVNDDLTFDHKKFGSSKQRIHVLKKELKRILYNNEDIREVLGIS